jgi:hypothetical protein
MVECSIYKIIYGRMYEYVAYMCKFIYGRVYPYTNAMH